MSRIRNNSFQKYRGDQGHKLEVVAEREVWAYKSLIFLNKDFLQNWNFYLFNKKLPTEWKRTNCWEKCSVHVHPHVGIISLHVSLKLVLLK